MLILPSAAAYPAFSASFYHSSCSHLRSTSTWIGMFKLLSVLPTMFLGTSASVRPPVNTGLFNWINVCLNSFITNPNFFKETSHLQSVAELLGEPVPKWRRQLLILGYTTASGEYYSIALSVNFTTEFPGFSVSPKGDFVQSRLIDYLLLSINNIRNALHGWP